MTALREKNWLEKYLGVKIIAGKTEVQDLFILLAKKVEKLEKEKIK